MRRKLSKVAVSMMLIGVMALTACGSDNSGSSDTGSGSESEADTSVASEPSSYTLSEYIGSGEEVLAYYVSYTTSLAKDTEIDGIYVFQGDHVERFSGFGLTMGDVSSMTDEETIEYCKSNVDSVYSYQYQVLLFTDDTGNKAKSELIRVMNIEDDGYTDIGGLLNGFNDIKDFEVYNSVFTAFYFESANKSKDTHNWFAFENAPTLTFDTPGTGNVIVDPFSL